MLSIEVELLAGRFTATAHNDRSRAEWPPHPARFFSALVAALYERVPCDANERQSLLWLERQPPPSLDADSHVTERVGRRTVLDVFVPVNDVSLIGKAQQALAHGDKKVEALHAELRTEDLNPPKKALATARALLPSSRTRQARTFPAVVPERTRFTYIWPEAPPPELRPGLDELCRRVTRLGHSSSAVRCAIADSAPVPTFVADPDGDVVMRTVGPGQLARLDDAFARHKGVEGRTLPAIPTRYRRVTDRSNVTALSCAKSIFSSDWIVFGRTGGSRPLSSRGPELATALRSSLLEQGGTLAHTLSGHWPNGTATDQAHIAFVPLPFVGHRHADASIQGCAIVIPHGISAADRNMLMQLIADWEKHRSVGEDGTMELGGNGLPPVRMRRIELLGAHSLRPGTWSAPSTRFVTVTPIALDRHPGNLRSNQDSTAHKAALEAQRCVATACEHIGLPRPISVEISQAPLLAGVQPAYAFAPWPNRPGRTPRVRVHADIRFAEPVEGPVILGAGRFFGLGLCLPVREELGH